MRAYEFHSYAELFPLMGEDDLKELAEHIREHGQFEPITLYEGKILDGRNRYRACERAGVKPRFVPLAKEANPVLYVLAKNLQRRHYTRAERIQVAVEALPHLREEAKKRQQQAGGDQSPKKGTSKKRSNSQRASEKSASANVCLSASGKAIDEAGAVAGISGETVRQAEQVQLHGTPELQQLMAEEKVSVANAAQAAALPAEQQAAVVEAIEAGERPSEAIAAARQQAPLRDALGRDVPEQFRDVFEQVAEFKRVDRQLGACKSETQKLAASVAGCYLSGTALQQAVNDIANAQRAIRYSRPHTICPYCQGRKPTCEACKGCGWVRKTTYDQAPREMK